MAVQTINTDIAAEVNITARRNDTFTFKFSVDHPTSSNAGLQMNLGQANAATYPQYQAKMSIVDSSTGDIKLSLFTSFYQNATGTVVHQPGGTGSAAPKATPPTATSAGKYSGSSNPVNGVLTGGAIDFALNSATQGTLAVIHVPYNYMVFEAGEYIYDLQIRKQTDANDNTTTEYTTWMFGTFTLNPDITTV